jgi:hypothetical protein
VLLAEFDEVFARRGGAVFWFFLDDFDRAFRKGVGGVDGKKGGKTSGDCMWPTSDGMGEKQGRCSKRRLVVRRSDPKRRFFLLPTNFVFSK